MDLRCRSGGIRSTGSDRSGADMAPVDLLHGFDGIDFCHGLIVANTNDSRKTKGVAAGMAIALLNSIKCNFENDDRFDNAEPSIIMDGVLFEKLCHLGDFQISQPRIRFPDVQKLTRMLHCERVVGEHVSTPAMAEFDTSNNHIERG